MYSYNNITENNPVRNRDLVVILMSTYNGEKYLREQLDSILAQENVNIMLIIRDDGSTDSTRDIIKEYKAKYKNIELIEGKNIGCEESFKELLYLPVEANFYAFADQDDIWHSDKLISAINKIKSHNCDLSVCNLMLVDAKGDQMHPLFKEKEIVCQQKAFQNILIGNLHGCVQVWTNKLHKIIQSYRPQNLYSHDVWVNLIANSVSTTYIDADCHINYRLHDTNTSGYAKTFYQRVIKGIKLYLIKSQTSASTMIQELITGYSSYINLTDKKFNVIKLIANYKSGIVSKYKLITSDLFKYTDLSHKILSTLRIFINKY